MDLLETAEELREAIRNTPAENEDQAEALWNCLWLMEDVHHWIQEFENAL